ncbi:hypothetical protein BDZ97DRAFT_357555 [Flammula alnicola]|nr:hypothetical protein BDZ97DRAFT_357555 [Flammula alnicola]
MRRDFARSAAPNRDFQATCKPGADKLSIRELQIHGLLAFRTRACYRTISGVYSPLTSLFSHWQPATKTTFHTYSAFLWRYLPTFLSAPVNLQSLALISDKLTYGLIVSNSQWESITFPNLTSLRIGGFVFFNHRFSVPAPHFGLELFISRHAKSLVHLDLSTCCINIEQGNANPGSWADVWAMFEERLEELETFVFEPFPGLRSRKVLGGQQDGTSEYEGYVTTLGSGFIHSFDGPPHDPAADKTAFESFQKAIAARRRQKNVDGHEP